MKLTILYTDGTYDEINSVTKIFPRNDTTLYYETINDEGGRGAAIDQDEIDFWEVTHET